MSGIGIEQELEKFTEQLLEQPTKYGQLVVRAPWTSDPNIKRNISFVQLVISFINAMKCKNSVQDYLDIYNKITAKGCGFSDKELNNSILSNYIVLASIITDKHERIFQNVFECVLLFRMKHFQITFLIDLLGMKEAAAENNISSFVQVLASFGIVHVSTIKSYVFSIGLSLFV